MKRAAVRVLSPNTGSATHSSLLLFAIWAFWLTLPWFLFGDSSYIKIHDNGDNTLASKLALRYLWDANRLGFWDPQPTAGLDRLAVQLTGRIDDLLYVFLPGWGAYGLLSYLQRFIAGYFTFLLFSSTFRGSQLPATYAGLSYALYYQPWNNDQWNGFTVYDGFATPGLPLILWCLSKLPSIINPLGYILAFLLGCISGGTSYYPYAIFMVPFIVLWFVFIDPRLNRRFLFLGIAFAAGWLLLILPGIILGARNLAASQRTLWTLDSTLPGGWRGHLSFSGTMVWGNLVPLLLGGIAYALAPRSDSRLRAVLLFAALSALSIPGFHAIQTFISRFYPVPASFDLTRIYISFPFVAITIAALSLHIIDHRWRVELVSPRLSHLSSGLSILLVAIGIAHVAYQSLQAQSGTLVEMMNGSNYKTLYENKDLRALASGQNATQPFRVPFRVATLPTPYPASVLNGTNFLHPAYVWPYGLESADGYPPLYSLRYHNFWENVITTQGSADITLYPYFHYWGARVYLFPTKDNFSPNKAIEFAKNYNLNLLSLVNVRYIISSIPIVDERLTLLPSTTRELSKVWEQQRQREKFLGLLRGRYPGIPLFIYENKEVLPRVFLAGEVHVADSLDGVWSALRSASLGELRDVVFVSRTDLGDLQPIARGSQTGEARIRTYAADHLDITVESQDPAYLMITNNFSPSWKATVDGTAVGIIPGDGAFQMIPVNSGQHQVVVRYQPELLRVSESR